MASASLLFSSLVYAQSGKVKEDNQQIKQDNKEIVKDRRK